MQNIPQFAFVRWFPLDGILPRASCQRDKDFALLVVLHWLLPSEDQVCPLELLKGPVIGRKAARLGGMSTGLEEQYSLVQALTLISS